jgi:hypothetical protein
LIGGLCACGEDTADLVQSVAMVCLEFLDPALGIRDEVPMAREDRADEAWDLLA